MSANSVLLSFIREVSIHPNTTLFKLNHSLITNSQFVQRIAPIMNELDTISSLCVPILQENEVQTYAAYVACILSGKVIVPIRPDWTEQQQQQILTRLDNDTILTASRMNYYFWMTVMDAMDRLDCGLIHLSDDQIIAKIFNFENEKLLEQPLFAHQISSFNVVDYPLF